MPTRMVIPMLMGLGPGMARRPRAPKMAPVMTRLMMNADQFHGWKCAPNRRSANWTQGTGWPASAMARLSTSSTRGTISGGGLFDRNSRNSVTAAGRVLAVLVEDHAPEEVGVGEAGVDGDGLVEGGQGLVGQPGPLQQPPPVGQGLRRCGGRP